MGRLLRGSPHSCRDVHVWRWWRCEFLEHVEKFNLVRGFREEGVHSRIQAQLFRGLLAVGTQGDDYRTENMSISAMRDHHKLTW